MIDYMQEFPTLDIGSKRAMVLCYIDEVTFTFIGKNEYMYCISIANTLNKAIDMISTMENPFNYIDEYFSDDKINTLKEIDIKKQYLLSTDYKMTVDYFATLAKEAQDELITKRKEAREFIRSNA